MTHYDIIQHLIVIAKQYEWDDIKLYITEVGWSLNGCVTLWKTPKRRH